MSRLNKRHDVNICDTNVTLLTLGEAVERWTRDGQFLMTEVNGTDSYQSNTPDIDIDSYSARISKIEAALRGMDFVKDVKKQEAAPVSSAAEPAPVVDAASAAGE